MVSWYCGLRNALRRHYWTLFVEDDRYCLELLLMYQFYLPDDGCQGRKGGWNVAAVHFQPPLYSAPRCGTGSGEDYEKQKLCLCPELPESGLGGGRCLEPDWLLVYAGAADLRKHLKQYLLLPERQHCQQLQQRLLRQRWLRRRPDLPHVAALPS